MCTDAAGADWQRPEKVCLPLAPIRCSELSPVRSIPLGILQMLAVRDVPPSTDARGHQGPASGHDPPGEVCFGCGEKQRTWLNGHRYYSCRFRENYRPHPRPPVFRTVYFAHCTGHTNRIGGSGRRGWANRLDWGHSGRNNRDYGNTVPTKKRSGSGYKSGSG